LGGIYRGGSPRFNEAEGTAEDDLGRDVGVTGPFFLLGKCWEYSNPQQKINK
jgi:hypothetical protein